MTTLVVGVGNPLRSDDGVGPFVAGEVTKLNLPGVEVRVMQQLNVELADELAHYEAIVVVDASEGGDPIRFLKMELGEESARPSSHHLDPSTLMALAKKIYKKDPQLYLLSIRAENLELGETLSENVSNRARSAVLLIDAFVKKR
jgi:hydrogenase maturation protease